LILAAVLNDSNFVPDLLVGLPTGGVHAANKLSGALSVLKGEMPLLWYTRPQAVKEESKAIFDGVDDSQKFREQELSLLVEALKRKVPQGQALKILIVDDGAVSGQTLR
jgi:hypoxanthine phosphoribosyltransferase